MNEGSRKLIDNDNPMFQLPLLSRAWRVMGVVE